MLNSSAEYLQALRKGDYLRFLEWPDFVVAHYKKGSHVPGGDELPDLLIFEWLNNGYCENDAKHFALLYAVSEDASQPLREKLLCALTTLFSVCITCMVYESNQAIAQFLTKGRLNIAQITALMKNNGGLISAFFSEQFRMNQEKFLAWAAQMEHSKVGLITKQVNSITQLRYLVENYILHLRGYSANTDKLITTRLSTAIKLSNYISEQTSLTLEVKESVDGYVKMLKGLAPNVKEQQEFLDKMSQGTQSNIWSYLAGFSSFFSTMGLLPDSETKAQQPESKQSP